MRHPPPAPYRSEEHPLGAVLAVHGISRRRIAVTSFAFAVTWTVMSFIVNGLGDARWAVVAVNALISFLLCGLVYLLRVRRNARLTLFERGLEIRERGVVRQIELSKIRSVEVDANALLLKLTSGERVHVFWLEKSEEICAALRGRLLRLP